MEFLSLDNTTQGLIAALVMIGFIFLLLGLIANIVLEKNKVLIIFFIISIIVISLELVALLEIKRYAQPYYEFTLSSVSWVVNKIPYFIHPILSAVLIIFTSYNIYDKYMKSRDNIDSFSIKEALENLPSGIAFISSKDEMYLSNHIMNNLSKEITGKDLVNGNKFWEDICSEKSSGKCVIKGEEPVFMTADQRVWQFCKEEIGGCYEIKATDITELYKLRIRTEQVNKELSERQKRLENLTQIIEKNAEEQVAVDMKINFHDNFGNLLTLTKKNLIESPDTDEAKVLVGYWEKITDIITELAGDRKPRLSLEQILLFGKKLGCEVVLKGVLPKEDENKSIILLCINEALKNAYRHANAKKINVDISENEEKICLKIHNEMKNLPKKISEGGGLSSLRKRIESVGGEMKIKIENGVTMEVALRRERNV